MYFLLEKVDFHCYVSLPEGNLSIYNLVTSLDFRRIKPAGHVVDFNRSSPTGGDQHRSCSVLKEKFGRSDMYRWAVIKTKALVSWFWGMKNYPWFQILFIFTPNPRENDPIWLSHIFQMGWNYQPALVSWYRLGVAPGPRIPVANKGYL